jgi:hypothetical protein
MALRDLGVCALSLKLSSSAMTEVGDCELLLGDRRENLRGGVAKNMGLVEWMEWFGGFLVGVLMLCKFVGKG